MTDKKKRRSRTRGHGADGQATISAPSDAIKRARDQAVGAIVALFDAIGAAIPSRAEPPFIPCDTCGLDARSVRRLVRAGRLAAVKEGRRWYAAPEALRALIPAAPPSMEPANDAAEPVDAAGRILNEALRATGLELAQPARRAARRAAR